MPELSFDALSKSPDFLMAVLDNISTCVLLLDNNMMPVALNNASKTLFSYRNNEHLTLLKCGNVLGCAWAVESRKECGSMEVCRKCDLREAALLTILTRKTVHRQQLDREFYTNSGEKKMKHLQFSTRLLEYLDELYVIVLVEDITQISEQATIVRQLEEKLRQGGNPE